MYTYFFGPVKDYYSAGVYSTECLRVSFPTSLLSEMILERVSRVFPRREQYRWIESQGVVNEFSAH